MFLQHCQFTRTANVIFQWSERKKNDRVTKPRHTNKRNKNVCVFGICTNCLRLNWMLSSYVRIFCLCFSGKTSTTFKHTFEIVRSKQEKCRKNTWKHPTKTDDNDNDLHGVFLSFLFVESVKEKCFIWCCGAWPGLSAGRSQWMRSRHVRNHKRRHSLFIITTIKMKRSQQQMLTCSEQYIVCLLAYD